MDELNLQLRELGAAAEHVLTEIRQKFQDASRHSGVLDSLRAFAAAVDWKEPWLIGLLAAEAGLLVAVVVFRDNLYVSGAILALAASAIYGGERLNAVLAQHWKKFAKQPYFDKHGIFYGAVISTPLLTIMFVLLINYLLRSSSLLIKLKRKELLHKAKQQAKERESLQPTDGKKQQ